MPSDCSKAQTAARHERGPVELEFTPLPVGDALHQNRVIHVEMNQITINLAELHDRLFEIEAA